MHFLPAMLMSAAIIVFLKYAAYFTSSLASPSAFPSSMSTAISSWYATSNTFDIKLEQADRNIFSSVLAVI